MLTFMLMVCLIFAFLGLGNSQFLGSALIGAVSLILAAVFAALIVGVL